MIPSKKISLYLYTYLGCKQGENVTFDILLKKTTEEHPDDANFIVDRVLQSLNIHVKNKITPNLLLYIVLALLIITCITIVSCFVSKIPYVISLPIIGVLLLAIYIPAQLFINTINCYEIQRVSFANKEEDIFNDNCVRYIHKVFPSSGSMSDNISKTKLLLNYLNPGCNNKVQIGGLFRTMEELLYGIHTPAMKVAGVFRVIH